MPDQMSAIAQPGRAWRTLFVLAAGLALLATACSTATTPAPRATISFLVQNTTTALDSYRFTGSATVADVSGPICRQAQTVVGTTWDPIWSFSINGQRAIGSTDSADLQPGASARDGLTVIIVINVGGIQTSAHAGPPLAGEAATAPPTPAPGATPAPAPTC